MSIPHTGCGRKEPRPSNAPQSESEAQEALNVRVQSAEESRSFFLKVKEAIRPYEAIIQEVFNILNERPGVAYRFRSWIDRFQDVLRETTYNRDILTILPNGTWIMNLDLRFSSGTLYGPDCEFSRIRIEGSKQEKVQHLSLRILDCGSPEWLTAIEIKKSESKEALDVAFFPKVFDSQSSIESGSSIISPKCQLSIDRSLSEMRCNPVAIPGDRFSIGLDSFAFNVGPKGLSANIHIRTMDENGKVTSDFTVIETPFEPRKVIVGL